MKDLLVGSTGFVGQNLLLKHDFQGTCHSTNVKDYYGSCPDICIYAGVPAAMYLANRDPIADLEIMTAARENLKKIKPRRVVLISTVAVYDDSRGADENSIPVTDNLPAYGKNRLTLEGYVREDFEDCLIVRLPALYGVGLKKNFIFDMLTVTPAMLKEDKYLELARKSELVRSSYVPMGNGFYSLSEGASRQALYDFFKNNDFNALSFTDSRSRYQFYNLDKLYGHIALALENGLRLLNISTPPISAGEVYSALTGKVFENILPKPPFDYDMRTVHSELFGRADGYIMSRDGELSDICKFVREFKS